MKENVYTLKVSSQGQVTLPRSLRERLQLRPGSRITVDVSEIGNLKLSTKLPIEKHFGSLPNTWTSKGQDTLSTQGNYATQCSQK